METDIKTLAVLVAMYGRNPMQRGQVLFDSASLLSSGDIRTLGHTLDSLIIVSMVYRPGLGTYQLTPMGAQAARAGVKLIGAFADRVANMVAR